MGLFSTSVQTFKKESTQEFFVDPFFNAVDIRDQITIRDDIKGTEKLNRISRPRKVTKKKDTAGFTPVGAMLLTQEDITVKPLAIEFEQNGRDFLNSVLQEALAQGFSEDDVAQMSNPDIWNQIVLPIIADAGSEDLIRQMFHADEKKELKDGAGVPTNNLDEDYAVYEGFWPRWFRDIVAGIIPAAQKISVTTIAVKQLETQTLTDTTAGSITLTINGKAYTEAFASDIATTVTNWLTSHAADLATGRGSLVGINATSGGTGVIDFASEHPGAPFVIVQTDAGTGGTWTTTGVTVNVKAGALGVDEADNVMEKMIDAAPNELESFEMIFIMTRSFWRNYVKTLKSLGTEIAHETTVSGQKVFTYEGIPVWIRPEWDTDIAADHFGIYPHRVVLTTKENLIFATDGLTDSEDIETWWNPDLQQRRYRVQYKAQTSYLHKELLVFGY